MNRHDYFNPQCLKNEPVKLARHSDGTIVYFCKNCSFIGTIKQFKDPFHISKILQQVQ